MISLIINADDLGSNTRRDRGILQAFQQGIVTSASILANGPSFSSAIEKAKNVGLPVGVHLNLADGRPLTGPIDGLTSPCGDFPGKHTLRTYLTSRKFNPEAIRRELDAQVQSVIAAKIQPDHLDGHQHCQLFPSLTGIVTELAREHAIPAMRSALPVETCSQDPTGPLGKELALYRQLSQKAGATIRKAGLLTPDGLLGMPLLNQLNRTNLCTCLEHLTEGFWELMVHPGLAKNSGSPFDGPQREVELQALLAPEAKQVIAKRNITLCNFGDLPCAS